MKLLCCYIENFGKLHEYRHTFEDGLNIILEENGWGKTTFAAFIKAMFYGMDYTTKKSITENERKRYMPWQGGNYGGYIVFEVKGRTYRIERFFGIKDKDDIYNLYDEATGTRSNDFGVRPGEELFGLDAFAYERSTYFPQESREMKMNDSLTARLSNSADGNDVENYQEAIDNIDARMKYYKKTGERGRIFEIEGRITEITHALVQYNNKTETVDVLKDKKAELENSRVKLFNELKETRDEMKKSSEYEGVKARKSHYDMLAKNLVDAKSRLDSIKLFFEKPELMKELDNKKDEYDNLSVFEEKYKDESENLKELEYRRHGLEAQFASHKSTPVLSFVMILFGILVAGCGVFVWFMLDNGIMPSVICYAAGAILVMAGIITWIAGNARTRREYNGAMEEVDELIDCSRIALREYKLDREKEFKSLSNYVAAFQVENPDNILKSLMEIETKIGEYNKALNDNEEAQRKLMEFENANEMDKIRGLQVPKYSLSELQKKETSLNNALMGIMEEKNSVARRMDSLMNSDEDEADLLQERDNLFDELKECNQKYEVLSMTREYLATANDRFKSRYIDSMKKAFAEYVSMFNGIGMDNVNVDIDLNVSVEEYGSRHSIECYSTGYRDMLSMCTRFALVKAMFTEEQPFLILDDPFVNFDSTRLENGMSFLEQLAENNQLLYFTCHKSRA